MPTDPALKHIPPQAIELEESILSSCLLGDAPEAAELLSPDDFYRTGHRIIFQTIGDMAKRGDPFRLFQKLMEIGQAVVVFPAGEIIYM